MAEERLTILFIVALCSTGKTFKLWRVCDVNFYDWVLCEIIPVKCLLSCHPDVTDALSTTIQNLCNLQYIVFKYSIFLYLIFIVTVFSKTYKASISTKEGLKPKWKGNENLFNFFR